MMRCFSNLPLFRLYFKASKNRARLIINMSKTIFVLRLPTMFNAI